MRNKRDKKKGLIKRRSLGEEERKTEENERKREKGK